MKRITLIFLILLLGKVAFSQQSATNNVPSLIPFPQKLEMKQGNFLLNEKTQLVVSDQGRFWNEIAYLQSMLSPVLGQPLSSEKGNNILEINFSDKVSGDEAYTLDITTDKVILSARTSKGIFYGMQTIRQLLPYTIEAGVKINSELLLPALHIEDQPSYAWRGSMIDVSRHFFSIEYLKKHIDRLALYKMNKLHLHLTDDQGWRIEIKKYPELTSQGAWRTFNNQDSVCIKKSAENPDFKIDSRFILEKDGKQIYGGYYTQDQIKDLIKYASSKHVEIIPEIDMPGHMMAAIAAYPYLTDSKEAGWGKLFSIPLCPCKDEVYTFVEDVLSEVMALFPSKYIHIGADEVEKTTWKESESCIKLMQQENIKDVNELQSYFVHKIQDFVQAKGKTLIGWDEVLEGGINSDVNIMYWRGWEKNAPQKAALNNNQIIMTPNTPLYFDYLPDKNSLRDVYALKVVYDNVPKDKAHLIKGAQANMWTETIPSEQRADFMLFPRLSALAERVWTNQELFDSYKQRILAHYPRLDAMQVNYRLPDLMGFALESVYIKEANFAIASPMDNMAIHYTLDGSVPSQNSPILNKGIKITKPETIKFALFSQQGAKGDIYTVNYKPSSYANSVNKKAKDGGLVANFYNKAMDKTTKISGEPDQKFTVNNIVVPDEVKASSFGIRYSGYINIPETGIYNFYFLCDDAGMLRIADRLVVDNEGPHSPVEKSGQVALKKGLHPFELDFVEGGGGYSLLLQYSVAGGEIKDIPDNWFVH
ncbi:MAG: family 20 glycosylhydrolase [Dysgonomonas sp.]